MVDDQFDPKTMSRFEQSSRWMCEGMEALGQGFMIGCLFLGVAAIIVAAILR